jgi:hypothetical protein
MSTLHALGAPRTPSRPGPGPVSTQLLRKVDLRIRRRIDNLLAGDHRAWAVGLGSELAQVRPYEPGDDVRLIDWNVTARTDEPHVRVHVAERAVETWLLLDTSASMTFGTADRRKWDVAEGISLAVGYFAVRRGNRLAVATFGDRNPVVRPARQSAGSRNGREWSSWSRTSAVRVTGGRGCCGSPRATRCSPSRSGIRGSRS